MGTILTDFIFDELRPGIRGVGITITGVSGFIKRNPYKIPISPTKLKFFIQSLKPPTRQWFAVVEEAIAKKRARNTVDTFSGSTVSVTAATILFPTDLF
jgi:hypothetical protein